MSVVRVISIVVIATIATIDTARVGAKDVRTTRRVAVIATIPGIFTACTITLRRAIGTAMTTSAMAIAGMASTVRTLR